MADEGVLDLGSLVPGGRQRQRLPEGPPAPAIKMTSPTMAPKPDVIVTPAPAKRAAFGGDLVSGADATGIDETLAQIAELVAHKDAAARLCVGLLGAAGSGKSFALARLSARIGALAAAATQTSGPYVDRIHIQPIDAAGLDGEPASSVAARLHAGLRQPYPDLAREIALMARDPHLVLRETNDKLDEARRRLDSERRTLDDAGSRRARLTETVLYEAAGSQVDAYARAHRAGIERKLNAFGLFGDPIRNYKDLVQRVAGSGGSLSLGFRALWAFKGQMKLIMMAIVLIGIGIALGIAIDNQTAWLDELRAGPQTGASVARWFEGHMDWLATAQTAAYGLAMLALVANVWRAFAFLRPIAKGARLLDDDLDNRRRDLDSLYAHQTKRVDALDGDVERLTRQVAEAERRASGAGIASEPSPFETAGASQTQSVFAVLARLMSTSAGIAAPKRIVLAIDHLDAVPPERGRAILDALHRLTSSGLVTLVAADPARLDPDGRRRSDLERWLQVPVRVDSGQVDRDYGALVAQALGRGPAGPSQAMPDARQSAFDDPISNDEATLLAALASLAGPSPRAVKRFVNLYAIARLDSAAQRGALALMLALDLGGTEAEHKTVAIVLVGPDRSAAFELPQAGPRLRQALEAARDFGGHITNGDAANAARRAAIFSI